MKISRNDVLFVIAILLAIWFTLTGTAWVYFAALYIAYPAGIISFVIWYIIDADNRRRNKWIPIILTIGALLSLTVLTYLLIYD